MGDAILTADFLEELADKIRNSGHRTSFQEKRNENERTEYSRYNRHGVGSKLLALKQAADWNGPGRKKRSSTFNQYHNGQ